MLFAAICLLNSPSFSGTGKEDKKDKSVATIFVRITVNGEWTEISFKEKIKASIDFMSDSLSDVSGSTKADQKKAPTIGDWTCVLTVRTCASF